MKLFSFRSTLAYTTLACSVALGFLAPGCRGFAQSSSLNLVANIPFAFRSGSTMMPAGKYEIRELSERFVVVRGVDQRRSQILSTIHTEAFKAPDHGKLIFHRVGNKYFLYQIWSPNQTSGYQLPKSHAEKETLRAENNPVPSTTELALNEDPQR